jgi:hypothetical protein
MADAASLPRTKRRVHFRPWVRALHRDFGYLAVGLTIVYAVSGLAVNHIADWDPNFTQIAREHRVPLPVPNDDAAAARHVLSALSIDESPRELYRGTPEQLDIVLDDRTLHVATPTGAVQEEGQRPRPLLRLANWLHLNRGKKAWTYAADAYAIALLFLATSGLMMIPGKKGFWGRGALIAGLGALVPILYVTFSGGP